MRTVDGPHRAWLRNVFVEEFMPKQKFVQQHSGDWAMTGKCSVAGRRLSALARTNRKDESQSAHQDHGRIAGR
jgi:hypothetical protein